MRHDIAILASKESSFALTATSLQQESDKLQRELLDLAQACRQEISHAISSMEAFVASAVHEQSSVLRKEHVELAQTIRQEFSTFADAIKAFAASSLQDESKALRVDLAELARILRQSLSQRPESDVALSSGQHLILQHLEGAVSEHLKLQDERTASQPSSPRRCADLQESQTLAKQRPIGTVPLANSICTIPAQQHPGLQSEQDGDANDIRSELRREASLLWEGLADLADMVGVDGARFIQVCSSSTRSGRSVSSSTVPLVIPHQPYSHGDVQDPTVESVKQDRCEAAAGSAPLLGESVSSSTAPPASCHPPFLIADIKDYSAFISHIEAAIQQEVSPLWEGLADLADLVGVDGARFVQVCSTSTANHE